jgi:predicted N-acetyltransferase YhbS
LWYLEVIAVHPALKSRGLGGGVMRWILDQVEGQPIYLECTRRGNVLFYQSFGFRVVEEVELVDDEDGQKLVYWVMIRS